MIKTILKLAPLAAVLAGLAAVPAHAERTVIIKRGGHHHHPMMMHHHHHMTKKVIIHR